MDVELEHVSLNLPLDDLKALRVYLNKSSDPTMRHVAHSLLNAILRAEDKLNAGKKLIKNSAECVLCGDVITSNHGHDFKFCKCGKIAVDGGLNYIRRIGEYENMIDRCEYA